MVGTARELVAALAAGPREAGTPDAARARAALIAWLEAAGYEVAVEPFRFTTAALLAFPIFGAGLGWLALPLLPLLLLPRAPAWAALVIGAGGLAALAALCAGIGLGWAGAGEEREDANLVARRPGATVRRWIVAHVDSKAQGHSMAGRLVAVWVSAVAAAALLALGAARLHATVSPGWAGAAAAAAATAGVLAGRGRLRGSSPGARDNATGLLAALSAAVASSDPGLGVLLTGAEEFGLVGARIAAERWGTALRGVEVVNCDTIDDEGWLYLVSHDRPGAALAERVERQLAALELPIRRRRLPLGIFVDSHPLARGGARAVTVGRLTWGTLRLLHTPRDTAAALDWSAAERIGRALASAD